MAARCLVGEFHAPVTLQQQHRRDRAVRHFGKPAQNRAGFFRLKPDHRRALQMRHQHSARLNRGRVEFVSGTRTHQTDDREKSTPLRQRQPHHRVHISRLHEAVVVVAREQFRLRHNLMVEFDRARLPRSGSQAHQVARAPDIEKLALAGSIDAAGVDPGFKGAKIPVDQRDASAIERLPQPVQRPRPALGENSRFIDRIEHPGEIGRIYHQASRGNEMARPRRAKTQSTARNRGCTTASPSAKSTKYRRYLAEIIAEMQHRKTKHGTVVQCGGNPSFDGCSRRRLPF
jgi:hypothetical protein